MKLGIATKTRVLDGLKTTGNYFDTLIYIGENLTSNEYDYLTRFFGWLELSDLHIGSGNIDRRLAEFESEGGVKLNLAPAEPVRRVIDPMVQFQTVKANDPASVAVNYSGRAHTGKVLSYDAEKKILTIQL